MVNNRSGLTSKSRAEIASDVAPWNHEEAELRVFNLLDTARHIYKYLSVEDALNCLQVFSNWVHINPVPVILSTSSDVTELLHLFHDREKRVRLAVCRNEPPEDAFSLVLSSVYDDFSSNLTFIDLNSYSLLLNEYLKFFEGTNFANLRELIVTVNAVVTEEIGPLTISADDEANLTIPPRLYHIDVTVVRACRDPLFGKFLYTIGQVPRLTYTELVHSRLVWYRIISGDYFFMASFPNVRRLRLSVESRLFQCVQNARIYRLKTPFPLLEEVILDNVRSCPRSQLLAKFSELFPGAKVKFSYEYHNFIHRHEFCLNCSTELATNITSCNQTLADLQGCTLSEEDPNTNAIIPRNVNDLRLHFNMDAFSCKCSENYASNQLSILIGNTLGPVENLSLRTRTSLNHTDRTQLLSCGSYLIKEQFLPILRQFSASLRCLELSDELIYCSCITPEVQQLIKEHCGFFKGIRELRVVKDCLFRKPFTDVPEITSASVVSFLAMFPHLENLEAKFEGLLPSPETKAILDTFKYLKKIHVEMRAPLVVGIDQGIENHIIETMILEYETGITEEELSSLQRCVNLRRLLIKAQFFGVFLCETAFSIRDRLPSLEWLVLIATDAHAMFLIQPSSHENIFGGIEIQVLHWLGIEAAIEMVPNLFGMFWLDMLRFKLASTL
ncbi:hypothetical protein Aperf_G00000039965 [Anoplocephala perfoliata]